MKLVMFDLTLVYIIGEGFSDQTVVQITRSTIDQGSTGGIRDFALRNFDLEVMEFESAHSNTTAKLPILKLVSTASFSDNVVYAFMIENPNGSNLLQQDLKQIYEDDLEAMDLKW
ncbi:hypothetical protein Tco_1494557 [Tanacetum coccineum]